METKIKYTINSLNALPSLAKQLLAFKENETIFVLNGDLGAGKTTFVKAIAKELSCNEDITSPTYSIVNEYRTENAVIYHFDLYRMNSLAEIEDIGFWDYFDDKPIVFIEWADLILTQLDSYIRINIDTLANDSRTFTFERIIN